MRKLLNTLYVTTPDAYLARDGENVIVLVGEEVRFRIPVHNIESIVCMGYTGASPALMGLCAERGVALAFLTQHGRFLARVTGPVSGNVLLRRKQYRVADDEVEAVKLAVSFIVGKIANSRTVIQRAIRDYEELNESDRMHKVVALLAGKMGDVLQADSLDIIRGLEGESAREYFSVFDALIRDQKDSFYFRDRNRRPPKDNMNALLSFLYTLLTHDVQAALETVGLDPAVGFLHRDRPGRPGLALDLMEELRPYLADRLALSLVNRKQVTSKGFVQKESGGIIMDDDTRKTVLTAWQNRKQEEITHPFLNEKIPIGLIPYVQALLLARHLRGDLDGYPPFLWK